MNPLKELGKFDQSVWLDFIRKSMIETGELKRLIAEDGLKGMTSNPSIFEKAIAGTSEYDETILTLAKREDATTKGTYEKLAIKDIQSAADELKSIYTATKKQDGYVSLEVSPELANDSAGTIEEAKRLWKEVNRPNLMIKVPGTNEGTVAIKELISSGINVNVTLLFSPGYYQKSANAFFEGLEARVSRGEAIDHIASVASFFISRIDSLVDKMLEAKIAASQEDTAVLKGLLGKVAIANAKVTYQQYKTLYAADRFSALAAKGAQKQRLLWASTSTKNKAYSDVYYVEELIGPETVNTIPPATFDSFKAHGKLANTLEADVEDAKAVMKNLAESKISFQAVTDQLLTEGIQLFAEAFQKLLASVKEKSKSVSA